MRHKLALLTLFVAGAAWGQTANCNIPGTGSGTWTGANTVQYSNAGNQCSQWRVTYSSQGFTGLTFEVDGAQDNNGVAGAFSAITTSGSCVVTGTNPSTVTTSGVIQLQNCYYPWIQLKLSGLTGTGSVAYRAYGSGTAGTSAGLGSLPAVGASTTYYVSTSGSDNNSCLSSGAACATLAHVMGLIPGLVGGAYTINVADGTYAEGINLQGYGRAQSISITGNITTPANVIFSGSVNCTVGDDTYTTDVCNYGGWLALTGVTLTGSVTRGIFSTGHARTLLNSVVVSGTTTIAAIESSLKSTTEINGNVTVSNCAAQCIYANQNSAFELYKGTVSITGNGTGQGLLLKEQSMFDIHGNVALATAILTVSNVVNCFYLVEGSQFLNSNSQNFGTLSCSNTSTPGSSAGIYAGTQSNVLFNQAGGMTINHFSTCIQSDGSAFIAGKNFVGSNCGTATGCTSEGGGSSGISCALSQQSQAILF